MLKNFFPNKILSLKHETINILIILLLLILAFGLFYALFLCISTFVLWDSSVETFLYGETFTETYLKIFSYEM